MGDGKNKIIFGLNSWQLSHLMLYFVFGYLCPNSFWFFLILGTLFEIYEFVNDKLWSRFSPDITTWWTGGHEGIDIRDIVINTTGFILGSLTKKYVV